MFYESLNLHIITAFYLYVLSTSIHLSHLFYLFFILRMHGLHQERLNTACQYNALFWDVFRWPDLACVSATNYIYRGGAMTILQRIT